MQQGILQSINQRGKNYTDIFLDLNSFATHGQSYNTLFSQLVFQSSFVSEPMGSYEALITLPNLFPLYTRFTLRKARSPLRINVERSFHRVNRL